MHNHFSTRRLLASACATAALSAVAGDALAQAGAADYPNKTITFVVPYAAGGSSDIRSRQIAQKLSTYFGKPVIVDTAPAPVATSAPTTSPRPHRTAT
jgi:tripartite-type tricarboxylate transporter receptor subunit TctC